MSLELSEIGVLCSASKNCLTGQLDEGRLVVLGCLLLRSYVSATCLFQFSYIMEQIGDNFRKLCLADLKWINRIC